MGSVNRKLVTSISEIIVVFLMSIIVEAMLLRRYYEANIMRSDVSAVFIVLVFACLLTCDAGELSVRAHNLVVNPSTGPVTHISVKNGLDKSYSGVLKARFPDGWKVTQSQHKVSLKPGQIEKYPFAIEKAVEDMSRNCYPIEITVEGGGKTAVAKQNAVWTSAPYYKPEIDGKAKEWKDAVPIAFDTAGKKTVVSLYWNKKQFCLLVEVEEKELIGLKQSTEEKGMDAVQFAISPMGAVTGSKAADKAKRCEFLVADSGKRFGSDRCYSLMKPGAELSVGKNARVLEPLLFEDALVAVKRSGSVTTYEIAVPFKAIPDLKPNAGREYCFSFACS